MSKSEQKAPTQAPKQEQAKAESPKPNEAPKQERAPVYVVGKKAVVGRHGVIAPGAVVTAESFRAGVFDGLVKRGLVVRKER